MLTVPRGEGTLQETVTLASDGEPGCFVEVEAFLREGEILSYSWRADEPLDFNIHAHREERVDFFVEERACEGRGAFHAPRENAFYLMWTNRHTEDVAVRFQASLP